ncbi:MAG: PTS sugar transporter subunit IIA [Verrucomicrobiota bacterium]|nr:PTS sugar transporter subunit IIA [Verrucomicrobiota bacterium]
MTLAELLTPERVIAELQSGENLPAIEEMVARLVEVEALPESQKEPALEALRAREDQRSTGIGGGIAIPHAFLPDLEKVVAIFARSKPGVDFCALDRAPVHFIVLFIVPESQYTLHLKTLAAIAKILNSADTRKRLAEANNENEMIEVLSQRAAAV